MGSASNAHLFATNAERWKSRSSRMLVTRNIINWSWQTTKTTCSGLDAAVDTPGIGAAGLTKLALVLALAVSPLLLARPTAAVDTLPILWEAGGQSSGNDSAGQAARVAVDLTGNVAVVSGPSLARDLAVNSYTSAGVFRWKMQSARRSGRFRATGWRRRRTATL